MAAIKMTLEGDREMKGVFKRLIAESPKELRRSLVAVGGRKLEILRARTPYKTGKLRASERMRVMVSGKREDLRISLLAGDETAWYVRIVESRTKFMESTILESVPTIGREIAAEVELRRAAGI